MGSRFLSGQCLKRMGNDQAVPVPMRPDLGMFCISLRPFRKVELIHAPPRVVVCVQRVANEVNSLYTGQSYLETPSKDKLGAMQFTMAADVFVCQSGKEPATLGKLFCIRILEELHKMGYDLQITSRCRPKEKGFLTAFVKLS